MTNSTKLRAIHAVIDTSLPAGQQLRQAQAVLDPLTEVGLAELRAEIREANNAGQPRFLCASCQMPLFVAQDPAGPDVPSDGRGSHFKHYALADAPACQQRTEPNLHNIGAVQFNGQAEGPDHQELKRMLALCLSQDPDVTDIQIERQIRSSDGAWRQPDVSAMIGGTLVAFDLQLAAASLITILDRNAFYAANNILHVWLTDAADLSRLSQLAFRDLYMMSGGRMFAIDADVLTACANSAMFQLKELNIAPRLAQGLAIHNVWETTLVGRDVIMMDPHQRRREGELRYRDALFGQVTEQFGSQRKVIRQAMAQGKDLNSVAPAWNKISGQIGGRGIDTAHHDKVAAVLAWLLSIEGFVGVADPEMRSKGLVGLQAATERLLNVRNAKDWAPLLEATCKVLPSLASALSADTHARIASLLTTTENVAPVVRVHAGMLAVLHPWTAFRLLGKAPKFLPRLNWNRLAS